jgi:outer membrane protein assembly factor BamB
MNVTRILLIVFSLFTPLSAADWPQWGNQPNRNMASDEKNIPGTFAPGKMDLKTEVIDLSTTKNIKWIAKLGSQSFGNVTVAHGRVFVGTNNKSPRNPKNKGDRGVVMCFDEVTGKFLWQLVVPKLGAGKVSDWEDLGICSSPTLQANRVYVITNRCEVVCLDAQGLANGNDGPFKDETKYTGISELSPTDADILWVYDMRAELGIFPHNITSSSPLLVGDKLYVTTSNGQDWSHVNIPNPRAPAIICLDKKTGKLLGEEVSGISARIFHCNWSSPASGLIKNKRQIIFGAGDGFCYGFDPKPVTGTDGFNELKELWRFDCNPPEHKTKDAKPIKYPRSAGPSEIIATPVVYNNRVYVAVGQDPEHGEGVGCLSCIDATGSGDISQSGIVWQYKDIGRTISTLSIANGLVFAAEYAGKIHCLDAKTGNVYWVYDTESAIWASTLVVDGKLFLGNEDGMLYILQATKTLKVLAEIDMDAPIYSSNVVANGTLYVATQSHLYAIANK